MTKKTLAEWAAIAEILGAIAIVISILFVGLEIRDSTRATQAATLQRHTGREVEFIEHVSSDPELYRLYTTYWNEFDSLSAEDLPRARFQILAEVRMWEDLYTQWYLGTLADEGWQAREPIVRRWALHPMFDATQQEQETSDIFAEYIIGVRAEAGL